MSLVLSGAVNYVVDWTNLLLLCFWGRKGAWRSIHSTINEFPALDTRWEKIYQGTSQVATSSLPPNGLQERNVYRYLSPSW